MSVVGLLFLLFEKTILSQSKPARGAIVSTGEIGLSRIILGVQVDMLQDTGSGFNC